MKRILGLLAILLLCAACRYGNRIELVNSPGAIVQMYQADSPQTLSKEVPIDLMRGGKISGTGL